MAYIFTLHNIFQTRLDQDERFKRIVLDVCSKKLFLPVRTGCSSYTKPKRRFIKIYFHNKGIDKVNLTNIFHDKFVKSKVPIYFLERDPPLISYQYTQNISRSVFNYNQTLYDIDVSNYNTTSSSGDCESSPFCYEPHGHIITGDLRIVNNRNLRRLESRIQSTGSSMRKSCLRR